MAKRYIQVYVGYRKTATLNLIVDDTDKKWKGAFEESGEFNGWVPQSAIDDAENVLCGYDFVVPEDDGLGPTKEGTREIIANKFKLKEFDKEYHWYDTTAKCVVSRQSLLPKKKPGKTGPNRKTL